MPRPHQDIPRLFAIAAGACRLDNAANIGDRSLGLPSLRACRAAPFINGETLAFIERARMHFKQCNCAVPPVQ